MNDPDQVSRSASRIPAATWFDRWLARWDGIFDSAERDVYLKLVVAEERGSSIGADGRMTTHQR
jgi:hypothetical protein